VGGKELPPLLRAAEEEGLCILWVCIGPQPARLASLSSTVVHLAGDDPLQFPRQLVRITIPSHHWQQRKRFANEVLSGWDSAPTPEHAEDWLAATRA
jgi:hypothetical protein